MRGPSPRRFSSGERSYGAARRRRRDAKDENNTRTFKGDFNLWASAEGMLVSGEPTQAFLLTNVEVTGYTLGM